MGLWAIVNQIGSLLFLQIDLIVVNILFGAASAGLYAIVLVWASLLRSMANTVSGVLTPVVFTYYAKGQVETLTKIMVSAVKLMGLLMALPIGLICGFAPQILTIWVGEKFAFLAPLLVLMALHLTINLAVLPLFSINVAYNKIRIPGVVTLLMGGMNIALAIAIPLMAGWGFYGVAVAGAIVLTLKNAIFTPWYATKVMGTKASTFNASMLPGMIATIVIIGVSMAIGILLPITSLASLILVGCIIGVVYLALIWKYGLSIFERGIFKNYLPKNLRGHVL
jgi:membrane protein EpsK